MAGLNNNSYDGYWLVAADGGRVHLRPPGCAHAVLRVGRR